MNKYLLTDRSQLRPIISFSTYKAAGGCGVAFNDDAFKDFDKIIHDLESKYDICDYTINDEDYYNFVSSVLLLRYKDELNNKIKEIKEGKQIWNDMSLTKYMETDLELDLRFYQVYDKGQESYLLFIEMNSKVLCTYGRDNYLVWDVKHGEKVRTFTTQFMDYK